MGISKKIKAINNKIKRNEAQYNLDRQAAKISALSSANVSKYKFSTGKGVLMEKDLLEKTAALKRFDYSLIGSELKTQTSVAEKQYQWLNKLFGSDKKEGPVTTENEKPAITGKSKLIYDSKLFLIDYSDIKNVMIYILRQNMTKLLSFYHRLNELR